MKSLCWSLLLLVSLALLACGGPRKSSNVGQVHYILGLSYLQEQNLTLALKEFLLAEEVDPDNADIQASLGQAYQLKRPCRWRKSTIFGPSSSGPMTRGCRTISLRSIST